MIIGKYLQNQQKNFKILREYLLPCFISKFITSLTSLSCNQCNRSLSSSLFIIFGFKIQNKMVAKLHFCCNNARKNVKLLTLNFAKPSYCYQQRHFTINLLSIYYPVRHEYVQKPCNLCHIPHRLISFVIVRTAYE